MCVHVCVCVCVCVCVNWFDLFDDKEEAPLMTCLVVSFNVIKCVHVCVSVEVCVSVSGCLCALSTSIILT